MKQWIGSIAGFFRTPPSTHLERFVQDAKYALRVMSKNFGFTAIAVLTLALGVGANTAIFGVIRGILLRPLPYNHPNELVIISQHSEHMGVPNRLFSVSEINDIHNQNHSLSDQVEYHAMRFNLLRTDSADRVATGVVSWNFFDFMGVKPLLGRTFLPSEEGPGAPPVLLLSYEYWQRKHNGDPNIVGKTFKMNDRVHTVIGVLPPVPQYPNENDVYMTTSSCPFRSAPSFIQNRNRRLMSVFARLKPDAPLSRANEDLSIITSRLQKEYPDTYPPEASYSMSAASLKEQLTQKARPTLWLLLAVAGFVLLIACANVANLTLARLSQREQELNLRFALGADRGRVLRQLFTESVLLGLFASGAGLFLAFAGHKLLIQFLSSFTPRAREITLDAPVLLFSLAVGMFTSVVTGSSVGFGSRRQMATRLREGTKQSTSSASRAFARNTLIVAQVAISFALLIGAGLMIRSFIRLQSVDPGFVPERLLTMAIDLNWSKYNSPTLQRGVAHGILDHVRALPGVINTSISSSFPLDPDALALGLGPGSFNNRFDIEGRAHTPGEAPILAGARQITPDYFKTLGMSVLRGRAFLPSDNENAPSVAIINQALAQHRWPNEDPVGRRITNNGGNTWITIVGVVGNTKEFGLDERPVEEMYIPIDQVPAIGSLLVRTAGDPMAMSNQVMAAVRSVDSDTAMTYVVSMEQARSDTLASPR
ncbi:MAG TPA: ABC transporter permease, partial [Alphaproteobacteria bacterium]|nr:ABC transporter permease [Alphaproteobacteria bacterium]